jgi:hypothetical protein
MVSVQLPGFSIRLNEYVIDNAYRQYPLLVYKNITYFPMTYNDCRFLGVETEWNGNELRVEGIGKAGEFQDDKGDVKNRTSYRASIAEFPIYVNGRRINNNEQQWPFLLFRDVTYFPLTWEFTVNDFHWSNQFSSKRGLTIDCKGKWTGITMYATLPLALRQSMNILGAATVTEKTIYYESDDGKIYCAPVDAPGQRQVVYELPVWTYGQNGEFVYPDLRTDNGRVFLNYRQGGASMGNNVNLILEPDGPIMELPGMTRSIGDKLIAIITGGMPLAGNLLLRGNSDDEFKKVGNSDLVHSYNDGIAVEGNFIYTSAFSYSAFYGVEFNSVDDGAAYAAPDIRVYRTDVLSGESYRITEESLQASAGAMFYLDGKGSVYYLNREGLIRKQPIAGGKAETVLPYRVSDFALTPNELYYVSISDKLVHRASDGASVSELSDHTPISTDLEVWNGVLYITTYYNDMVTHSLTNDSIDNPFNAYWSTSDQMFCTDGIRLLSINREK